jgi:hypothetical protein
MKRILLSFAAVAALAVDGLFTSTAEAHGPYGYGCRPNYGGYGGAGYGRVGYGGYGYGGYGGYSPTIYSQPFVPYGAGYSGGWQPYQGAYARQPRIGVYFGY